MGLFQSHKGVFDKNTLLKGTLRIKSLGFYNTFTKTVSINRKSVTGSLIQATEAVEFEDGWKT